MQIVDSLAERYAPDHDPPLGGYAALLAAHLGALAGTLAVLRKRGIELGTLDGRELILAGVGTYKLSRVISRSWIGTALRAPFTRYVKQGSGPEVKETARGEGLQEAVGDLVTCPFCTAHWVATGLVLAYDVAPGPTRAFTRILAADAVADALQYVRGWLTRKTTG